MLILVVMEIAIAALVVVGIFTQIIVPLLCGTPYFPAFQKHGLEAKLAVAKQDLQIAKLEQRLRDLEKQAEEVRSNGEKDETGAKK